MASGDLYEVERIVDKRRNKKGKWEYLIRWKGYGSKEDTWEPEHHLLHCEEFIEQFNSLGLHKAKFPKSRQEPLIPRYPTAAETSRARSESRKKKRTCDPAVGVRAGDVLGMGSGGSGPMQKQRKVGVGPGRHDLGLDKAMIYKASSHGGSHFSPAAPVPHNGLQNGELEPLIYRTAARSHRLPLDRGDGELGDTDPTGQQFKKRGSALANGKLHLHSSIKRKLAEEKGYVFDKRLRHNVRQNESNCRFRDIVVRKEEGFTHVLLSTQTTENNALTPEENGWTVKHITELEMTHVIDNPSLGIWNAYQLLEPQDDVHFVELTQFKEQFKAHLRELVKPVSIKIKKHSDEAIWIRIAWGDHFSEPNHFKPAYVVHHLQTPYVFITGLNLKKKKLLCQALVLATRYQAIKDANLHGRNLDALRDVLMRQYQQVFPTAFPCTLAAVQQPVSNVRIDREQSQLAAARVHMASEAFGCGALPELQSAVYKLETKFKDNANKTMMGCEEPFRCFVKFSSSNLLESFRHCASSGIASTPVTPLLSSILQKGRNHFVITDNGP